MSSIVDSLLNKYSATEISCVRNLLTDAYLFMMIEFSKKYL